MNELGIIPRSFSIAFLKNNQGCQITFGDAYEQEIKLALKYTN